MKMKFCLSLAAVLAAVIVPPAFADDADSAAILKAIQSLSNKVDGLQNDVDKLKNKGAAVQKQAVGRSAPAPAPAVSNTATKGKSVPGWLVNVVPGDDVGKDSLATFAGPTSSFNFGMHTKYLSGKSEIAYRGNAFFHPTEAGRYVFVIDLSPLVTWNNGTNFTGGFNCEANFKIADNTIVNAQTAYRGWNASSDQFDKKHEYFRPQDFSGGADLEAVDYKVSFQANCFIEGRDKGEVLEQAFPYWQDNKFSILVKGPDDEKARPFEGSELFHVGRPKKS